MIRLERRSNTAHNETVDPELLALPAYSGALGIAAGLLTTSSGFGGGMLITLGLSVVVGPADALAIGAPALLVGHAHRAVGMRASMDRRAVVAFCLGGVPGAVLGAWTLVSLPPSAIWGILLLATLLGVAEFSGKIPRKFGRRMLGPGAFGIGWLAAAAGVGGILLPPVMLSAGLSGTAFVATAAAGSVAISGVRIIAYGAADMFSKDILVLSGVVAVGVMLGNVLGLRVLAIMTPQRQRIVAGVVLAGCVLAAAYGLLVSS